MRTRLSVASVASLLMLLCLPRIGHAEGISCAYPTVIVADGRIMESSIPASTTFWYVFDGKAGRSYSLEIKNPLDKWGTMPGALTVYQSGGCSTPITPTSTTGILPRVPNNTRRVSFTATGTRNWFTLANSTGSPVSYTISLSETTLFSPRWSTYGDYTTGWGFHNTTNATISGTLKVYTTAGTQVGNATFDIPSERVAFKRTTDFAIAANQSGNAMLTHNGPPGAIQADGYMISPDGSVIVPVKFEPVREAAH